MTDRHGLDTHPLSGKKIDGHLVLVVLSRSGDLIVNIFVKKHAMENRETAWQTTKGNGSVVVLQSARPQNVMNFN